MSEHLENNVRKMATTVCTKTANPSSEKWLHPSAGEPPSACCGLKLPESPYLNGSGDKWKAFFKTARKRTERIKMTGMMSQILESKRESSRWRSNNQRKSRIKCPDPNKQCSFQIKQAYGIPSNIK